MHQSLLKIRNELEQISSAVNALPNNEPLSIAHNNWSFPGLTRTELSELADKLIETIDSFGSDETPSNESDINDYGRRITHLRVETVPQIWGGNCALAVSNYLSTLAGLKRALEKGIPSLKEQDFLEVAKSLKRFQTKIRAIEIRIEDIEPRSSKLSDMIDRIEQAHETADQLPTDLATLKEARIEIQNIRKEVEKDSATANKFLAHINECDTKIQTASDTATNIISHCESALRTSTSFGLAAAFYDEAESLTKSLRFWIGALILALVLGAVAGGIQLRQLTEAIETSTPPMIIWTRLLISLLSVGAPVWFAWLATKQIGQRFRLAQDYAYKASISKAYEGYRREAVQLDEEFQNRLFSSALARLDEQPLRFVESKTHGSPWHELLDSDVFKQAVKLAPDLVGKFAEMAREQVETAKKVKQQSKDTSKIDSDAETTQS